MFFKNSKGMTARVFALAATMDNNHDILLASFIGAITEVKAIWASILNARSSIRLYPRHKRFNSHPDLQYRLIKNRLARGIHHWTLFALPAPEAPVLLLLGDEDTRQTRLVELLNTHTLWPVLPEWGQTLWEHGSRIVSNGAHLSSALVHPCQCHGPGITHAYAVRTDGWDELLDDLAQQSRLSFAKE